MAPHVLYIPDRRGAHHACHGAMIVLRARGGRGLGFIIFNLVRNLSLELSNKLVFAIRAPNCMHIRNGMAFTASFSLGVARADLEPSLLPALLSTVP